MTTIYISIGNSDDKLTQAEWSKFQHAADDAVHMYAAKIHGRWHSWPHDPWQNACWCIEIDSSAAASLRLHLAHMAFGYRQDSIAWAVAQVTEFITPAVTG